MRKLSIYALCCLIALLPACSMLTPQQREDAREAVQAEYKAGRITKRQRDATIEALDSDEPVDLAQIGMAAASVVASILGVRWWRGPSTRGKPTA